MKKIEYQLGVGDVEITEKEKKYVMDVLERRRLTYGYYTSKFESEFAKLHDVKYAVMCNSGTSALRVAVAVLKETENWKDGDEILVPAVTFISTSNVIIQHNLKPVFVDVEEKYYCIDPQKIEEKITDKTRAIMVVHLFGMPCDMDPILELARKYNLKIIEDSCETMFAKYKGESVGSFGDIACFSTYAAHILVTGVGGFVLTNNSEYAVILKSLINHGRDSIYLSIDDDKNKTSEELFTIVSRRFKFVRLGYSFRVTEMEAALGLAQLERKDRIIETRQKNASYLIENLKKFEKYLQLPAIRPFVDHSFMMFPIVVKNIDKHDLVNFLEENNIETRDMLPLLNQPVYVKMFGDIEDEYPVAKQINKNGFFIGCHPGLKEFELKYIISKFEEFFNKIDTST